MVVHTFGLDPSYLLQARFRLTLYPSHSCHASAACTSHIFLSTAAYGCGSGSGSGSGDDEIFGSCKSDGAQSAPPLTRPWGQRTHKTPLWLPARKINLNLGVNLAVASLVRARRRYRVCFCRAWGIIMPRNCTWCSCSHQICQESIPQLSPRYLI